MIPWGIVFNIVVLVLTTSMIGVVSSWGFILPYLASYLRDSNTSLTLTFVNSCYYVTIFGDVFAVRYFEALMDRHSLIAIYALSLFLYTLSYLIIYLASTLWLMVVAFFIIGFADT